jgi:hypothetical protein
MKSMAPIQEFRDRPSKVNKKQNRFCLHEQCKVKLSRYNFTDYCSVHESIYYKIQKSI